MATSVPVEQPTQPGWYQYSGGANVLMFLRTERGQWHAFTDNGESTECTWGYIEQALGVWDLVLVAPLGGTE